MAWTAPRTWVDGELVTAALMNTHVRDNELAAGPHLIVRKTSDQSVTSSAVLVNDTALILPLAANEVWHFVFALSFSANQTANMRVAFTFPAAGEIGANGLWADASGVVAMNEYTGTTTPTAVKIFQGGTTSTGRQLARIEGVFINAGTAGNLTLQWAQGTSNATATIMRTNSTLWAVKLA